MATVLAPATPETAFGASQASGVVDHPTYGRVRYTVEELSSDPDEQVAQTIRTMQTLAVEDSASELVRQDLEQVRRMLGRSGVDTGAGAGSGMGAGQRELAEAIFWHVKGNLRFVPDNVTGGPVWALGALGGDGVVAESLIRPVDMVGLPAGAKAGDCDDYSMYVASLLEAAKIPWAFVTVAASAKDPEVYSHVYVAAYPDGVRLPLDASHGPYPGWEASQGYPVWRQKEWSRWALVPWWMWLLLGAALLTPGAADEIALFGAVR